MAQVQVTIAGRAYRMACGEGEEAHLTALAARLDGRIDTLRIEFGEIGDQRITVMAAITLADELAEAERRIAAFEAERAALARDRQALDGRLDALGTAVAAALDEVTAGIETAARELAGGRGLILGGSVEQPVDEVRQIPLLKAAAMPYLWGRGAAGCVWHVFPGPYRSSGSCPWPCPWTWPHGAHLRCRFPGSTPTATAAPHRTTTGAARTRCRRQRPSSARTR